MIPVPDNVLDTLLAEYDINREDIALLGGNREGADGITYTYNHHGIPRVLKVLAIPDKHPEGLYKHEERLKFVRFLGEHDAPIVFPQPSRNEKLYETCHQDQHTFLAYTMNKISGVHPRQEEWNPAFYRRWGQAIGKLHRLAKEYPLWQHSLVDGKPLLGWREEWEGFYQWCKDAEVKECWQAIRTKLEGLPITREGFGFTHNDPHIYNLLADGDRLCLLDFDVANYMWFVNDISIAMQAMLFSKSGGMDRPLADPAPLRSFLENFMAGYEQENHLDSTWLPRLDLFIAYRRILLFTVMQGGLEKKPEARLSWKKQILDWPEYIQQKVLV